MSNKRIVLGDNDIPSAWYNLLADLPQPPPPPLDPATNQPVDPAKLGRIFARGLLQQEMSCERWIDIPDEVRRVYAIWRPTPLVRARGLEKALETPARIYFKDESHSPPGSHKPNTAVAQAYYNKLEGIQRLTTETGAGQWGGPVVRLQDVRREVQGLHGQGQLPPEALPADDDAHLGRRGHRQPFDGNPMRPGRSWKTTPIARAAWASPSARRSRRPSARKAPGIRWAAC